jgi:hypothetical protein
MHDNAPAHKDASVCQFLTQENVTTLYHPPRTLQIYLRQTIFCSPSWKKLKGLHSADVAEIQEAVTDELRKFQKEEFSAAFQKMYDRAKVCIYANGASKCLNVWIGPSSKEKYFIRNS